MSEGIDSARVLLLRDIHLRDEHDRVGTLFPDPVLQVVVDFDMHRLGAMGALRSDYDRHRFSPQLPLHEGRRKRVRSSGAVELLTRAEGKVMGCLVHRHGVGPDNGNPPRS